MPLINVFNKTPIQPLADRFGVSYFTLYSVFYKGSRISLKTLTKMSKHSGLSIDRILAILEAAAEKDAETRKAQAA